jgi:hypothetical protein
MKRVAEFVGFLLVCATIVFVYTKFVDSLPEWAINIGALAIGLGFVYFVAMGIFSYMAEREKQEARKREELERREDELRDREEWLKEREEELEVREEWKRKHFRE